MCGRNTTQKDIEKITKHEKFSSSCRCLLRDIPPYHNGKRATDGDGSKRREAFRQLRVITVLSREAKRGDTTSFSKVGTTAVINSIGKCSILASSCS